MKTLIRAARSFAWLAAFVAGAAVAQGYPDKPIRLIVPYAAGGGTDVFARTVSTRMSQELGQQIVVENHPGAGTIIGASVVAKAPPDGYVVLLGDSGTYAINPSLYKKLPYDPLKDFAPVTLTGRHALALIVHPSVPARTVPELIALIKANPGKFDYASPGPGSPHQLAMEQFRQMAGGLAMTHVPYKGSSAALQDLLAGRIPCMFMDLATIQAYLDTDKIRVLGAAGSKRLARLPNVPTVAETLPGFDASAWQGFSVPAGTPQAVVDKLNQAYARAAADPAVLQRLGELNIEAIPGTPAEMGAYMKSETVRWAKIVKDANVSLD